MSAHAVTSNAFMPAHRSQRQTEASFAHTCSQYGWAPPPGCQRKKKQCEPHWHAVSWAPAHCPLRCRPGPESCMRAGKHV
eukprot:1157595-Pelagomonas_calceolata.AAC.14